MRHILLGLLLSICAQQASAQDILNIRTNPFMAVSGRFVNLGIDVRTGSHWSLGATVQTQTDEPLYKVGLRANYFESETFLRGWQTGIDASYLVRAPEAAYYDADSGNYCWWDALTMQDVCDQNARPFASLAVTHGYIWRWDRFNVMLGLGSELTSAIDRLSDVTLSSTLNFSIGWVR